MVNINWLSSLWAKNSDHKALAIDGLGSRETPTFEKSSHEFMFDNLMGVPFERIGKRNARPFENG